MSEPDVVVIGGGAAGLGAAVAAAEAGATVTLVDERAVPGGRLRSRRIALRTALDQPARPAPEVADDLARRARLAGAALLPHAAAWALFPERTVAVGVDGGTRRFRPRAIVVATGSTDLPLPFPGASLPGVFPGRGVLIAINAWGVLPGRRWALVGNGPELAEVAAAIGEAGGEIVASADPGGGDAVSATGERGIESVTVNGRPITVDCVAITAGRQPDVATAIMAGCTMGRDGDGSWVPVLDPVGRSSVAGVLVAGEAAGLCSPEVAVAEGRLAGLAAAVAAGRAGERDLEREVDAAAVLLGGRRAARQERRALYAQAYR